MMAFVFTCALCGFAESILEVPQYVASTELDHLAHVARSNQKACGPVALAYVMARTGHPKPTEDIIAVSEVTELGITVKQLLDLSSRVGVPGEPIKTDPKQLSLLPVPSLLFVDGGMHCVVYDGFDSLSGNVIIFNPEDRQVHLFSLRQVTQQWTGEAVIFGSPYISWLAFYAVSTSIALFMALPAWYLAVYRKASPRPLGSTLQPASSA
jgi:hypothetical protein